MRKFLLAVAAPFLALLFALAVTTAILMVSGHPPVDVYKSMWDYGTQPDSLILTLNLSTTYYIAAVAVAIGFKMNLFNIGVDGQYRLAAMLSAAVAGAAWMSSLPGFLRVAITLLVAMAVGAAWAGVAALLKVTRGVSEVISTIMLNYIATYLVAYLLKGAAVKVEGSNATSTAVIAESSRVPGISVESWLGTGREIYGLIFLAIAVGILFWFVLTKTRFGFDLRATGRSESAAIASGVNVKKMVVTSMILSGAIAGLVGMPLLFGQDFAYGDTVQAGLGFAGMSVAQLERYCKRVFHLTPRQMIHKVRLEHADRKSTRLNSVTLPYLVCRLLLEKKKKHSF